MGEDLVDAASRHHVAAEEEGNDIVRHGFLRAIAEPLWLLLFLERRDSEMRGITQRWVILRQRASQAHSLPLSFQAVEGNTDG